jgi:hypothetical protein
MKGYYRNEKATRKTVIDGWLHTGDIARYTEDKQFFIVDRLKELIKVKGLQVMIPRLRCYEFGYYFRKKSEVIIKNLVINQWEKLRCCLKKYQPKGMT